MPGDSTKRYPPELRERAVRMVAEIKGDHDSEWAAMAKVAELLGVGTPETVRKWVRQVEVDAGGQVVSKAVVFATGVTADRRREVLGLDVGDSEDEVFWRTFLTGLKTRGLGGVRLVISDQHSGLVAALRRAFQRVSHQRCRVHFARNLLAHVPKGEVEMVAAVFRTICAQPDGEAMAATWDQVRDQLAARFAKNGRLMDDAKAQVLAFSDFPPVRICARSGR